MLERQINQHAVRTADQPGASGQPRDVGVDQWRGVEKHAQHQGPLVPPWPRDCPQSSGCPRPIVVAAPRTKPTFPHMLLSGYAAAKLSILRASFASNSDKPSTSCVINVTATVL